MKEVFATHGIPKIVQTDNVSPFNSTELKELAEEMGFTHEKITPRHPKAQGQVEGFNKLANKTAAIARAEGIDLYEATYDMFQAYRETSHPATGTATYEQFVPNSTITQQRKQVSTKKSGSQGHQVQTEIEDLP